MSTIVVDDGVGGSTTVQITDEITTVAVAASSVPAIVEVAPQTGPPGPPGADAQGLPTGGTTGQILTMGTSTPGWSDAPVALPPGGTTGQVLTKASATAGDAAWNTPVPGVTPGSIEPPAVGTNTGTAGTTATYSRSDHTHDLASHTHAEADITGLTTDLAGKVPTTRTVAGKALSADVTLSKGDVGLGNVDNTADAAKAFAGSQITSGTVPYAQLPVGTAASTVAAGNDSRITGAAQKSANLSDLAVVATARTNLGLGGAATLSVGTTTGTVAAGDDSRITGAAQKSANLSDLAVVATARTNLGLGGAATLNVGTAAGTVAAGNDSRLSDARTPTAHASTHVAGAADPVSLNGSQITAGTVVIGRLPGNVMPGKVWNGTAYVDSTAQPSLYIGPSDPGAVAAGSLWIQVP